MATEFTAAQVEERERIAMLVGRERDAAMLRLLAEKLTEEEKPKTVDRNGGPDGFTCLECGWWRPDADAENHSKHAAGCSRFQPTPDAGTGPLERAVPFSDNTLKDYQRPLAEAIGDARIGEARTCGYCNGSGAEGIDPCPYCGKNAVFGVAPLDLAAFLHKATPDISWAMAGQVERAIQPWLASRSAESAQLAIQEHQRDEAKILKLERDLRTALFFLSRAQLNEFDRRTR